VDAGRNLLEKSSSELLMGGELGKVDGDQDLLGLFVDITNIDTTLVCEQNPVALKRKKRLAIRSGLSQSAPGISGANAGELLWIRVCLTRGRCGVWTLSIVTSARPPSVERYQRHAAESRRTHINKPHLQRRARIQKTSSLTCFSKQMACFFNNRTFAAGVSVLFSSAAKNGASHI
jgi:hypothetical protein